MSPTGKGCLNCTTGSSTGEVDPNNPYRCVCNSEFTWSSIDNACVCLDPNSIILSDNTCFSCLDPLAVSNGTRVSATACGCPRNYIWSSALKTCTCDNSSILINDICISCSTIQGGNKKIDEKTCSCKSDYVWNINTQSCDCVKSSKCVCPTNFTLVGPTGTVCVNCATIPGSNGLSAKIGCSCLPGFTWNTTLYKCVCSASMVSDGSRYCVPCNSSINAVNQLSPFSCNCVTNHVWNRVTGRCDFVTSMANTKNLIMKPSG